METIIQHFAEKVTSDVEKELEKIFVENNSDISQLIEVVDGNLNKLGAQIIKYILEQSDKIIKESPERLKQWVVQSKDMGKTLITEFGEVKYKRTYYKSKGDEGYTYLVDDKFGIERYQRIDTGLSAKLIELAKEYSYQKSADLATHGVELSRQTVKNKIRELGEIDNRELDEPGEKKQIKKLYVEADEDHIALQNGKNTISKLVYVHEGVQKGTSGRNKLKNVHYFSGLYKDSEQLWLEVTDYIHDNYDIDALETVYLAGDGAGWITEGLHWLPKSKYVLDRYHLNKYVLKATGHLPKIRPELWDGLNQCSVKKVEDVFIKILDNTEKETKKRTVKDARKYILNNWGGIEIYHKDPDVLGCSAEGHISHVLSERLSSRPLGWSKKGAEQMSRLRAFKYNGGTKKELYEILKRNVKVKKLEIKTGKMLNKKKQKSLLPKAKETIPALKKGKVTATFRAVKSLAF